MPTNGIHLVLGISGICPFLPAPSATLLSPTVLVAVSYRRLSFSHFVFSSYSICMYFVLVHNSNKKRRILCTLYILVCACVFITECCKITHTQCGSHIPKTALCITLCIMFVLTNYANGMQEMPSFELKQQLHRCFFFRFCFSDCAAAHCPACFIKCGPQSICVFMT